MAKSKHLRHGIVGLGIGRWHMAEFSKIVGVKITAVADVDASRLDAARKDNPDLKLYDHYEALCADPEIDSVSICLPNALHAPAAVLALKEGKHVLCEKPLADTLANGEKIVKQAAASGRVAMIAMKLRFGPEATFLRRQVESGKFGQVYYSYSTYLRGPGGIPGLGGWFTTKKMSGGGALIDNGVHLLDLQWYLMGCPEPVAAMGQVRADFGPQIDERFDVDDFGAGCIRFRNGALAQLDNAWASMVPAEVIGLRVLGQKGGGTLWPFTVVQGDARGAKVVTPPAEKLKAKNQFQIFAECVLKGTPCPAPVSQGLTVLKMLDALYKSARSGRSVAIS